MDSHRKPADFPAGAAPEAVDALVDEHYDYLVRLAWSILDDAHDAQDAAQESLLAALKAMPQFRGQSALRTWLYRIAVNVCRRRLRQRRLRALLPGRWQADQQPPAASESAELAASRGETDRQLHAAIDGLDDKHRLPLILHYLHDLTAPEIARVLDISEGTVYSRLHHARHKLRLRLSREDQRAQPNPEAVP